MTRLAGVGEAAVILKVSKQRVNQLMKAGLMPRPIAFLAATPVWDASEIEQFALTRSTRPAVAARKRHD